MVTIRKRGAPLNATENNVLSDPGPQRTLARRAEVSGFGFWSGQDVTIEFLPAPEDYGIRFTRTDLTSEPPLPALLKYRIQKPRQTSLLRGDLQVDMIEHVMATLRGLGIDNCQIRIGGPEMPGLDGSSIAFTRAILDAGIVTQNQPKRRRVIREPIRLADGDWSIEALPSPNGKIFFAYDLDYPPGPVREAIGQQSFELILTPESFQKELAGARTFLMESEARELLDLGLCKRVTPRDVLVFTKSGPIDNSLRYPDECARHKVLDLIGDSALAGAVLVGHFRARKTGHWQNAELIAEILEKTELE